MIRIILADTFSSKIAVACYFSFGILLYNLVWELKMKKKDNLPKECNVVQVSPFHLATSLGSEIVKFGRLLDRMPFPK